MADSPLDSAPDPAPVAPLESNLSNQAARGAALLSIRQIFVGLVTVTGIIALPLLLTPAEFSLYGYVSTVILIGAALGDLGIGAYIIKSRLSDRDMSRSLGLQISFWAATCLILIGIAALANPFGFSMLTSLLLVVGLLLFSLQALPTAVLEKEMRFKRISAIEIVQRVLLVGIAISLAAINPAEWSIPLAAAVAAIFGYPAVMIAARWRWRPAIGGGEPIFRGFSSQWWQVRIANQAAYAAYPLLGGLLFSPSEVGLIVWALAITSIPAYLAPMVARATFPILSRAQPAERVHIYSSLFRGLLILGMPMIAGLLVAAGPLTENIFGPEWTDGIPLLRLESITTFFGIATTSVIPFLFLSCPPTQVKWVSVATTSSIVVLAIALAPILSYLSISVATIICVVVEVAVIDRMLYSKTGYSLLRDMLPAAIGLIFGVAVGLAIVLSNGSLAAALGAGVLAALIQVSITFLLKGGIDPRTVLRSLQNKGTEESPAV